MLQINALVQLKVCFFLFESDIYSSILEVHSKIFLTYFIYLEVDSHSHG